MMNYCPALRDSIFVNNETYEIDMIKFRIACAELFDNEDEILKDDACEILVLYEKKLADAYNKVLQQEDFQNTDYFRTVSRQQLMDSTIDYSTLHESIYKLLSKDWDIDSASHNESIDDLTSFILSKKPTSTLELYGYGVRNDSTASTILNYLGFARIAITERSEGAINGDLN